MIDSKIHIIDSASIKKSKIDVSGVECGLFESLFGHDNKLIKQFMQYQFQKCPVVIRGSNLRIDEIKSEYLNGLNVLKMLENTASDEIQVWLKSSGTTKGLESIKVPTAIDGNFY